MRQSLHLYFSMNENCESVQTINVKQKYKLQRLFEMLSVSLDTGLQSFSPLVNGPVSDGQFEVIPDVNHSLLQFSQIASWLLVFALLDGAVVAVETTQVTLTHIKRFKWNQLTLTLYTFQLS